MRQYRITFDSIVGPILNASPNWTQIAETAIERGVIAVIESRNAHHDFNLDGVRNPDGSLPPGWMALPNGLTLTPWTVEADTKPSRAIVIGGGQ